MLAKKNLIVGILYSLGWWETELFMMSLKKSGVACELLVCVSEEMSEWTIDRIKSFNSESLQVTIKYFPPELKGKYSSYIRFKMIEDHLAEHRGEYDQVLMSDMRDVIIQGDPFKPYAEYDSYLAYSTESHRLAVGDKSNKAWVLRDHGAEALQQIKGKYVICAGLLLGTADAMEIAMHELNKYIGRDEFNNYGADQGTLNYLIYTNKMPVRNLIDSDVSTGYICSIIWNNTEIVDDKILSVGGKTIPAAVHEYNRHPRQYALANRIYRSHTVQVDKHYTDLPSLLDIAEAMIGCGKISDSLSYLKEALNIDVWYGETQDRRVKGIINAFVSQKIRSTDSLIAACAIGQMLIKLAENNLSMNIDQNLLNIMQRHVLSQCSIA